MLSDVSQGLWRPAGPGLLEVGVANFPSCLSSLVSPSPRTCHAAGIPGSSGHSASPGLARPAPGAVARAGGVGGTRAGLAATCRPRYGRQGVQQPHPEEGLLNRGQQGRRLLVAPGDCAGGGRAGRIVH